jgi:enamine deaminase RidA (YjgF/YER057c/UK114 family)
MTVVRQTGTPVQGILPAPSFRRAGDFVFVSSIYPLDGDGHVVHARSLSPYVGEAEVAAQTRACLETLQSVLAEAGTSLERVVKAEVYLVDPADFYEFKLVWREYFPTDPPARTTAIVGDEHIVPGCRLNLHAIALAGDSAYRKEAIRVPDVPDPMEAEHAPQAVKAGPFVFPSGVPATDFKTGIPVGKQPGFPNYGSDAEMQAHYFFQNLEKVLREAGSGLDQALKAQLYEPDLSTSHDVDGVWGQYLTVPPTRSSMAVRGLLVPGAVFVANLWFLSPNS